MIVFLSLNISGAFFTSLAKKTCLTNILLSKKAIWTERWMETSTDLIKKNFSSYCWWYLKLWCVRKFILWISVCLLPLSFSFKNPLVKSFLLRKSLNNSICRLLFKLLRNSICRLFVKISSLFITDIYIIHPSLHSIPKQISATFKIWQNIYIANSQSHFFKKKTICMYCM